MSSTTTETTPLIRSKVSRNVTFNPNPEILTAAPLPPPISSNSLNLHSKLRRRNSHGAPGQTYPPLPASKIGPQRTTKNAQKLKILPNPDFGEDGPDEESGRDVYSQYTRIKDPTARRDAARLGKADRERLPRVTAYCTANKYQMDNLMRFLKGRGKLKGANPKLFDECIYTPYNYHPMRETERKRSLEIHSMPAMTRERRHSDSAIEVDQIGEGSGGIPNGGLERMHSGVVEHIGEHHGDDTQDFDILVHTPEIFLFDYGVVVIWGMSLKDETRFLKEIAKFENEKLALDNIETEEFNFYYTKEYQARIYNDFITLRDKGNYMTKLAISHALAQSVKVCLSLLPSHF